MADTYTCEVCHKTFEKGVTDEEAAAEFHVDYPGADIADTGIVCDDCYQNMKPWIDKQEQDMARFRLLLKIYGPKEGA